jgi:hypothetical protein
MEFQASGSAMQSSAIGHVVRPARPEFHICLRLSRMKPGRKNNSSVSRCSNCSVVLRLAGTIAGAARASAAMLQQHASQRAFFRMKIIPISIWYYHLTKRESLQ